MRPPARARRAATRNYVLLRKAPPGGAAYAVFHQEDRMTDAVQTPASPARHAVILCHPDAHSFNHAIAETYCDAVRANGQEAILRDLYAIGFDPVLKANERPTLAGFAPSADVERELAVLRTCDVFVLVYPIWFGTPPAMVKGYIERVLGSGVNPKAVQAREST